VPAQDGVRADDGERVVPGGVEAVENEPQEPVAVLDLGPLHRAPQDTDLLAEGQVLKDQVRTRPDGATGRHGQPP
jgi:hypothetical protein